MGKSIYRSISNRESILFLGSCRFFLESMTILSRFVPILSRVDDDYFPVNR